MTYNWQQDAIECWRLAIHWQSIRARCNFETDGFAEVWRDTPEKAKCGKDHINYKARVA